ncbi:MAG: AAA family ATPase [Rhodoglobus sp.]
MSRILVTGMSGAGKSTLLAELGRRGFFIVDTDYGDWERPDGLWDERRMAELLSSHADVVVTGTVENQGQFYDRFDHVVLLSAPVEVLIKRVATRTNNPYGHSTKQQDEIRRYVAQVEPLLRRGATTELDGRRSVLELADAVAALG